MAEQTPNEKAPAKQTAAGQAPAKKTLSREELAKIPDREKITAEMVANVWKVIVREGGAVQEGDTLVILESMKMEIPVVAETNGTVKLIAVAEGDVVQEGDLIAVVG